MNQVPALKLNKKTGKHQPTPKFMAYIANLNSHEHVLEHAAKKLQKAEKALDKARDAHDVMKAAIAEVQKKQKAVHVHTNAKLTSAEIVEILEKFGENLSAKEKKSLTTKLNKLKFDPHYVNCFTNKEEPMDMMSLYNQAITKVQCWAKYGDEL